MQKYYESCTIDIVKKSKRRDSHFISQDSNVVCDHEHKNSLGSMCTVEKFFDINHSQLLYGVAAEHNDVAKRTISLKHTLNDRFDRSLSRSATIYNPFLSSQTLLDIDVDGIEKDNQLRR